MPPAAHRGRLRGGRQGEAPPGPPIRTALIVYLHQAGRSNGTLTKFVKKQFECKFLHRKATIAVHIGEGAPPPGAPRVGAPGGPPEASCLQLPIGRNHRPLAFHDVACDTFIGVAVGVAAVGDKFDAFDEGVI